MLVDWGVPIEDPFRWEAAAPVLAQHGTSGFDLLHKPYSAEGLSRILGRAVR